MSTAQVSEVSICNLALSWLAQAPIISLDDPNNTAQLCKINYPLLRDAVLEEGDWQFAFQQAALAQLSTPPVFGTGYLFAQPSDMIRLLRADDGSDTYAVEWRKEGPNIRAEVTTLYIEYVKRVEDTSLFSPGFVQALAGRLAAELAMPITNSSEMFNTMWKLYGTKVRNGLNLDNLQSKQRPIRSDQLTRVR
jgi:hypothetical protein